MDKKIKIFGAALDPIDYPMKVLVKCSYLSRLAQGLIDPSIDFKDPYEGLLLYSQILSRAEYVKVGKFPVESWLTPKPSLEDYDLLNPQSFQDFVNEGKVYDYSLKLKDFVKEKIFPDIPLLIGTDHSLTGGVLNALAERYGAPNILVIIFDAHFDAIPASICLELTKYAKEHQDEVQTLINPDIIDDNIEITDTYSCASFIDHLINDKIVLPKNLIIFGCQDYPSEELLANNDPRVKEYVDYYLSFEARGVKFIPGSNDAKKMAENLQNVLNHVNQPYIYISFDVDVGSFKDVFAPRFMNTIGIERESIIIAAKLIKDYMDSKKSDLIGLDLLEIETHMLSKELKKSGKKDKTVELVDEFLSIILHKD